jgi:hypothetical protein
LSNKPTLFLIDRKSSPIPYSIDVTPPEASEVKLAGGQRRYIEDLSGVDIALTFGSVAFTPTELRELELLRGSQGLHMLSFNNISCDDEVELLVYMPKIPHIRMSELLSEHGTEDFAYSATEVVCHQVNTAFEIVQFEWIINEAAGWSTGTGKYRLAMPAAGRFINVPTAEITGGGISGMVFVNRLSSQSGNVTTRLRNATQGLDIVDMVFNIASGAISRQMTSKTLPQNKDFVKGDIIELNVVSFSGSAGSAVTDSDIILVQALCEVYGVSAIR